VPRHRRLSLSLPLTARSVTRRKTE
jgi:hypothetical protein